MTTQDKVVTAIMLTLLVWGGSGGEALVGLGSICLFVLVIAKGFYRLGGEL